jgi:L-threonylcarbamoyladenylate synthase
MPAKPNLSSLRKRSGQVSARTYRGTPRNLAFLARRLRLGDVVGVPTETVYGLAADATDAKACGRIFAAKRRPRSDPLIVHIASRADLSRVAVPNAAADALARKFWPGPLTLILPKTGLIPDAATADQPSVAVRLPAHPLFRRLIALTGRPLAAPSANPFGYVSPTTAEHVRQSLGARIRHILDGGPARIGLESTIVDLRDPRRPVLLRPGAITRAALASALGRAVALPRRGKKAPSRNTDDAVYGDGATGQIAPGQGRRHYSPATPVTLHRRLTARQIAAGSADEAWLCLARPRGPGAANVFWLDPRGDLRGAARTLFARLRQLDRRGFRRIHAERAPARAGGLADALNDRLERAAARD